MMRIFMMMVGLTMVGSTAVAQDISVTWNNAPKGVDTASLESGLKGSIGSELALEGMSELLSSMANAAAISSSGIGVDYVSNPRVFVFGASMGAAGDGTGFPPDAGDAAMPSAGFASTASMMVGANLGALTLGKGPLSRFRIYAHGLTRTTGLAGGLETRLDNYGGHLQVAAIKPRRIGLGTLEWGGLSLTTGYEKTIVGLSLTSDEALDIGADVGDMTIGWDATGTVDVTSTVHTIPFEMSTNLRVLMFAVYGGAAFDITPSDATASLSLSGPISLTGDNPSEIGVASVSFTESASGAPSQQRLFAGAQLDLPILKLYTQANLGLNGASGFHMGARASF
jgi:hypothetical protein